MAHCSSTSAASASYEPCANHPAYHSLDLMRGTGVVKIILQPKDNSKKQCINRIVSWIEAANFTLDIVFFDILHKKAIKAIIKKQRQGVRVRLVIYRHLTQNSCSKVVKHLDYINRMMQNGIKIRYVQAFMANWPSYRMLLIDLTDEKRRPQLCGNDPAIIFGHQPFINVENSNIVDDMQQIILTKSPQNVLETWYGRFMELWVSIKPEVED